MSVLRSTANVIRAAHKAVSLGDKVDVATDVICVAAGIAADSGLLGPGAAIAMRAFKAFAPSVANGLDYIADGLDSDSKAPVQQCATPDKVVAPADRAKKKAAAKAKRK